MESSKPKDVNSYIASQPKEFQEKLRELRSIIKKTAPNAIEKISYSMPYYGYNGRLAYFLLAKNHIGLYLRPQVLVLHKKDLQNYETSKATIRFPHDTKLPAPLIRKLIRSGIQLNNKS